MDQSRDRHVGIFAARVGHFERGAVGLFDPRNHLATDRAIRIFGIDQIEKVRGNCERQLGSGQDHPGAFFPGKCDLLFELLEIGDAVFKLPFPVVPKLGYDIGPETWSEGKEAFIGGFG